MIITIVLVTLLVILYVRASKAHKYWKERKVPYVKPFPLLGNFASFIFRKHGFYELIKDLYNAYPDSRYVGFYQFLKPFLMIRDPELIKQIGVKEFDTFPEHRTFASEDVDPLWGKNLFAIKDKEKWHDLRCTLSPAFTNSKMKMMFSLISDCAKQFTNYFESQQGAVTVEMKDMFTRFTNDVVASVAFGVNCNSLKNRENQFYLMGKEASNFNGTRTLKFLLYTVSPTLMKILNIKIFSMRVSTFFKDLINQTIQFREENKINRPDMIQLLMEARKGRLNNDEETDKSVDAGFAVVEESDLGKDKKRGKPQITIEDITAQALIFFVAGFETAATLMSFCAYELAINQDVQEKLQKEIDEALLDGGQQFTYEKLMKLKYLDMVVTETLRKWPPTPAANRVATKPFTIKPEQPGERSVSLKVGSICWFPISAIHRDPKYYSDPDKFDPERFNNENKSKIDPFTFLPFGVGPRNCIGSRFALLEGKLVIAELVSKFDLIPYEKTQIPLRLSKRSFTLIAEKGIWLQVKPRKMKR